MEINGHIDVNAKTKKARVAMPTFTDCRIRFHIDEYGYAELEIWQRTGPGSQRGDFGLMATVTLHEAEDMAALGGCLTALASATAIIGRETVP